MAAMRGPEAESGARRTVEEQLRACIALIEGAEDEVSVEDLLDVMELGAKTLALLVGHRYVGHIASCGTHRPGATPDDCTCGLEAILHGETR
jgi:hypothetical protein